MTPAPAHRQGIRDPYTGILRLRIEKEISVVAGPVRRCELARTLALLASCARQFKACGQPPRGGSRSTWRARGCPHAVSVHRPGRACTALASGDCRRHTSRGERSSVHAARRYPYPQAGDGCGGALGTALSLETERYFLVISFGLVVGPFLG